MTINTNPGTYYSAHGDVLFVVYDATKTADPATYPDYRYVADIYVGATLVARVKKYPQPDNKRGVFNIGDIIRSYVSATFNPTPLSLVAQELALNEFFVDATVKFGEEYGFTLYTNVTVDSERRYFNHYNGQLIGQNTILADYVNKVASMRPQRTDIGQSDSFTLIPYLPDSSGSVDVTFTNSNGSTFTQAIIPFNAHYLQILNISPAVANNLTPGFVGDSTQWYDVDIGTETYRLNITCDPRFETYNLHFLNRFGGFDTKGFSKASRKSQSIERASYGKLPYTVDSSGAIEYKNANGVYNEQKSVYATKYTEKLTLNSDLLTDAEYLWLSDLILSPMVFMEQGGYLLPVMITSNSYDFRKTQTDKLTNLTIEIEFGSLNAQYR